MSDRVTPSRRSRWFTPGPGIGLLLVTLMVAAACDASRWTIPLSEGPLQLSVVYPDTQRVAVTDSISTWGSVGNGKARLTINGQPVRVEPNGAFSAFLPLPATDTPTLEFEVSLGDSIIRRTLPIVRAMDPARHPAPVIHSARGWVRLARRPPVDTGDLATRTRPVYSRWVPEGNLAIPLPLGARLPIDAQTDSAVRVRISDGLAMWVSRLEAVPDPGPTTIPTVAQVELADRQGRTSVSVSLPYPVPWTVDMVDGRLQWTLHGVKGRLAKGSAGSGMVTDWTTRPAGPDRMVVDLGLSDEPLGWRVEWSAGQLRLEVRATRHSTTLAGLVVALDPGHPPVGSTGPTGLTEAEATLAVAIATAAGLEKFGAHPVLIRQDATPLSLDRRVQLANDADPDVFVSIHLNAPGDGRPPQSVEETRVFWIHRAGRVVAQHLRDSVSVRLEVPPGGIPASNLVVLRSTWFPTVLVEATGLVIPLREAMFRTPEGIQAYADGLVAGLAAWAAQTGKP